MMRYLILMVLFLGCSLGNRGNEPPIEFTSTPELSTDHNRAYNYSFTVQSKESENIIYQVTHPDWIKYDEVNQNLSGIAAWENLGTHLVQIIASDGVNEASQSFSIQVVRGEIICNQDFGDPLDSPYVLPYKVGESSKITQSYCRVQTGGHHLTFAYDFEMAMGDTIRASRAGLVYRIQESYIDGNGTPGSENFIYIEHDDGTVFRYVHLTENGALIDVNTRVEQGQPIGLNGLTGATSSPHLHLELFRNRDFNSTNDRSRKFSLPVNFKNAEGPLDSNNGLILNEVYTAMEN